MPIESNCQGCGRMLRVGDEHAGKLARCPHCQTIYTVPSGSAQASRPPSPFAETAGYPQSASSPFPSPASEPKPGGGRWTMKTPDGLTFGPVSRAELDKWLAEGRITPQSQLQQEGTSHWLWAGQVYSQLQAVTGHNPFGDSPTGPAVNPYAPPTSGGAYNWPTTGYRFREQHRGGTILAMGLVSIPCCEIIAIVTIVMAIIDLQKMSNGTMDPSGRGLVIGGLVCAIIKLVLVAGYVLFMIANQ